MKFILYTFVALIIFSCAQIVPLTGGEKDIDPPQEIESSPVNGSTLFTEETIVVEFDEYIKLTNVSSQLIVSPLMESPPEVMVKGKKLVIKLKSELTPNTTYSLNFGNAISDITENNIFPNYKYVFSTGDFIDSLTYSGTVINAFDLAVKENVYVLLYDQFEDSVPLKVLPRYVGLTDKEGNFSITNIANGAYKLFAIKDINSNYLFDLPNEEIGFYDDLITINSSDSGNFVYLFKAEKELQFVLKSEHKSFGEIDLVVNKPSKNLNITPIISDPTNDWGIVEKNTLGDSLKIWLSPNMMENKEQLNLIVQDNNETIDTLNFGLINSREFKDSTLQITSSIANTIDLNKNVRININRPFKTYKAEQIKLYEDSTLITNTFFTDIGLRKFELAYDFKEKTNYQFVIPAGAFEDIYGLKNDTFKLDFKSKKEADYGIINLSINPNFSENYIVQLSTNKQIVAEDFLSGVQKRQYKYLKPGIYSLKIIIDKNNDKHWNTGNYLKRIQPEKVIIYQKEIKIRPNWDNDINWTLKE